MRRSYFGEFDSAKLFTSSPETAKRGRPPAFSDGRLRSRCHELMQVFEYYWADLGWHLPRAKSLAQLRAALRRAEAQTHHSIELFVLETPTIGTAVQLSSSRAELVKTQARLRTALEDEPKTKRKYEQALNDVNQLPEHPRLPEILRKAERNWTYLARQIESLRNREERLRREVREREAHCAQSQLLDFVHNAGRYRMNALNISKAMAGVPRISWRQSAQRLANLEISHPFPYQQELWETFYRGFGKTIPKNAELAIERFAKYLINGPKKSHAFCEFREHFYYVKIGTEQVYEDDRPRSSIPYAAFIAYRKRSTRPQPADESLAEEDAL